MSAQHSESLDRAEVAKFAALAERWWDRDGAFAALHRMNPTRLAFIRDRAAGHFGLDAASLRSLAGLRVLDIGCGGGLLAEPLARLGASVTGLDAAPEGLEAARRHAAESGLAIDYREGTAEALAQAGESYDLVLAMEIVEHVAEVDLFLEAAAALVRPGGAFVLATLNRTPKAFLAAIVGAEYLLGWLPRGTHDWRRFLKPAETARLLRGKGLLVEEIAGLVLNPLSGDWRLSRRDLDVNYLVFATRPPT